MSALLDLKQSQSLQVIASDLWFAHRAEERALARLPEAALLAAELMSRLPVDQHLIQDIHADSPFSGSDAGLLRLALTDTYWKILADHGNEAHMEQLLSIFGSIHLNMATYDFIAMRILGLGVIANADKATQFFQFKSARRQFNATLDVAVAQMQPYIQAISRQLQLQDEFNINALNDLARQTLRVYVHETRRPVGAVMFLSGFLTRLRERLGGVTAT